MLQKAPDFSKLKTQQSTWHPASWPPMGKKILAPDAWHLSPGTCRLAHLSITSHRHLHLIIINRPAVPSLRLESGSSWGCPPGPGAFRRSPAFVIPNRGTCRLAPVAGHLSPGTPQHKMSSSSSSHHQPARRPLPPARARILLGVQCLNRLGPKRMCVHHDDGYEKDDDDDGDNDDDDDGDDDVAMMCFHMFVFLH